MYNSKRNNNAQIIINIACIIKQTKMKRIKTSEQKLTKSIQIWITSLVDSVEIKKFEGYTPIASYKMSNKWNRISDKITKNIIIKKLDNHFINIIVDSGQHYDYNLNKIFYDQLEVRPPDYNLDVKSGTHATQVAKLIIEFEKTLVDLNPDFVIVLGDNNSSLGFSLATSKLNTPPSPVWSLRA